MIDDRTFRIIVVSATLAAIGVFKPQIMRWLHKIGYTGSGLGKDKPEKSGDESERPGGPVS
jgi:hypothetical protein